jgi:hypothetical protein
MALRPLLIGVAIASLCFSSGVAPAAETAARPRPGDEVRFCGQVIALTEAKCIAVRSGADTYEISSIGPKPKVGSTVVGAGYVGDEATTCMEGVHLRSAMWKRAEVCPAR